MVGDKTIAFWLMDSAMYDGMSALAPAPPAVEKGIALHKVGGLATARVLTPGHPAGRSFRTLNLSSQPDIVEDLRCITSNLPRGPSVGCLSPEIRAYC